jgi:5'-nucleotidase
MMDDSLNILLTNDDGIQADGLWALYHALHPRHRVTVVAPDRERSAVGHGITLKQPLRAEHVKRNGGCLGWAVSGTPADCIKLAVLELLDRRPDLVISGINPGANVGINMNYSGTVAAAKEASVYGLSAMAVSIQNGVPIHYDAAARFVSRFAPVIHARGLPSGTFLNINVPNLPGEHIAGVRVSRQGADLYNEYFEKRQDPRNSTYYWQGSESEPSYASEDADGAVLRGNSISITPVRCDMTDYDALRQIRQWVPGADAQAPPERIDSAEKPDDEERLKVALETAGGVCHKLNQPLQFVLGSLQIMMMDTPPDAPKHKELATILKHVEKMGEITRNLADITTYRTRRHAGGQNIPEIDHCLKKSRT